MDAAVRAYRTSSQHVSRDQLIVNHLPLVRHTLGRMLVTLPDSVDRENLEAAGVLGLVEAAHHFDPSRNVEFGAFASYRIRGAILDELRRNCPLPQHMLERWAQIRNVIAAADGPVAVDAIATLTGLTGQQVEECLDAIRLTRPETWQQEFDLAASAGSSDVEQTDRADRLTTAILQLDERMRTVVVLYYRDELRLKEIGAVLELSESRISRLLKEAHLQLKTILGDDFNLQ